MEEKRVSYKCILTHAAGGIFTSKLYQYHGRRCPGALRHQITSSQAIDYLRKINGPHCSRYHLNAEHYSDIIMSAMASQITSLTIVCATVYSGVDQRKHQSSASLALVRGIHRWPVNSPHKGPVTRKMFPFDDVIMAHDIISMLSITVISNHERLDGLVNRLFRLRSKKT